jgi:hypothetical protein
MPTNTVAKSERAKKGTTYGLLRSIPIQVAGLEVLVREFVTQVPLLAFPGQWMT